MKRFSEYPQWCAEILQKFLAGSKYEMLPVADRRTATSTAHVFNRARTAFCREGITTEQMEVVKDIICRPTNIAPGAGEPGSGGITGKFVLEFTPRGLAIAADESRGTKRGIPSPLRDDLPGFEEVLKEVDATEDLVAKMLSDEQQLQEFRAKCVHEWDATDTRCLLCGTPKP